MANPLFTGSGTDRFLACPPSAALPQVRTAPNGYQARGNVIHEFLALVPTLGRDAALSAFLDEERMACEAIDLDQIPQVDGAGYAAEVAFAFDYDLGTAREIGRNIGRNYGDLAPTEIPLTVDVVGLGADGESVFVGDYKTGHGKVTPSAINGQLMIGGLAASRAYGRSRAEVAIIRVLDGIEPFFDRASFDEWDLDAFAIRIRQGVTEAIAAREQLMAGGIPYFRAGDHCHYCNAFPYCPAQASLLYSIANQPSQWAAQVNQALRSDEERLDSELAVQAYSLWLRAKEVVDRAGAQIYAYASEYPIDLGNGKVLGPVRSAREYLDGQVVHKVLTDLHGRDVADRAVTLEATKAGLKDALRPIAASTGAKLSHLESATLAAVKEAGGIDRRESATVREHVPKKRELEA
jgi:hypothetical protein